MSTQNVGEIFLRDFANVCREAMQSPDLPADTRVCIERAEQDLLRLDREERIASAFNFTARHFNFPAHIARSAFARGVKSVLKLWDYCESPIETALAPWLVFQNYGPWNLSFPAEAYIPKIEPLTSPDVCIIPQVEMCGSRFDFCVLAPVRYGRRMVIVECDGAEFHMGWKDRPRDTYFRTWGIPTIRASGAEIYTQPYAVAARVANALNEQVRP